jgi:hypothetical protein
MPELAAFTRGYPEIEIDLLSTPEPAELAMREAEVALLVTDRPPPTLVGRRLATLPSALYAARRYLAERPADGELGGHLWVGWEDGMSHIPAARWLREQVPDARIACRVSSGTTLRAAIRAGVGIGHLLCFLAEEDPGSAHHGPRARVPRFARRLDRPPPRAPRGGPRAEAQGAGGGGELKQLPEGSRDVRSPRLRCRAPRRLVERAVARVIGRRPGRAAAAANFIADAPDLNAGRVRRHGSRRGPRNTLRCRARCERPKRAGTARRFY